MKTSIKIATIIASVFFSLCLNAQRHHNSNSAQQQQGQGQSIQKKHHQNHPNNTPIWSSNQHYSAGNLGGSHVQMTNYPNYYGYYNTMYSIKKIARYSIRQSAQVISQALHFSDWNDTYSPRLAKAIRHQQYAKQLYFWGDYNGALNHSERAEFLAWNALTYFNHSIGYNDFSGNMYPNASGDTNNPYYRKSDSDNASQEHVNSEESAVYKNGSIEKRPSDNGSVHDETRANDEQKLSAGELDTNLPQSKLNDQETLKTNATELDVD